jgi:hypothetical protein
MVDSINGSKDLRNQVGGASVSTKKTSLTDLKVLIDSLNEVSKVVYGKGAAKMKNHIDPVGWQRILKKDE